MGDRVKIRLSVGSVTTLEERLTGLWGALGHPQPALMRLLFVFLMLCTAGCFPERSEAPDPDAPAPNEQFATGTITGEVRTSDDRPVPNAVVYLREIDLSTTTGVDGRFAFDNLSEGTYSVEAVPPGTERAQAIDGVFATAGETVGVQVGDTARITLRLPS